MKKRIKETILGTKLKMSKRDDLLKKEVTEFLLEKKSNSTFLEHYMLGVEFAGRINAWITDYKFTEEQLKAVYKLVWGCLFGDLLDPVLQVVYQQEHIKKEKDINEKWKYISNYDWQFVKKLIKLDSKMFDDRTKEEYIEIFNEIMTMRNYEKES
jgi:hypothetical protein